VSSVILLAAPIVALLIPPALPGEAQRYAEFAKQQQQLVENLESDEAKRLVEDFFTKIGEGEAFDVNALFAPKAQYIDISDEDSDPVDIFSSVDGDGFPDIPQWELISMSLLSNSWGAFVQQWDDIGLKESVLKFYFERDAAGSLKISRIEELRL